MVEGIGFQRLGSTFNAVKTSAVDSTFCLTHPDQTVDGVSVWRLWCKMRKILGSKTRNWRQCIPQESISRYIMFTDWWEKSQHVVLLVKMRGNTGSP